MTIAEIEKDLAEAGKYRTVAGVPTETELLLVELLRVCKAIPSFDESMNPVTEYRSSDCYLREYGYHVYRHGRELTYPRR